MFESYIEGSVWPSEPSAGRENILSTTKLNNEIKSNSRNKFTILQPLLQQYEGYCPMWPAMKKSKFKSCCNFPKDTPKIKNRLDKAGNRGLEVSDAKKDNRVA